MHFINLEHEIDNMIASGLYKTVDLRFLHSFEKTQISDDTKDYLSETMDAYQAYLKLLDTVPIEPKDYKNAFLEALKEGELQHNQESEHEDLFLLELYKNLDSSNSIDTGKSVLDRKGKFDIDDIQVLHHKIMQGTANDSENNYDFRTNDKTFVGSYINGDLNVDYFPIKPSDIETGIKYIIDYLNQDAKDETDILVRPIAAHLLVAAIQAFDDGNTRLARLIFHLKLWDLSKKLGITYANLPTLYMSKSFILTRPIYRERIKRVIIDNDDHSWNDWIKYNLNAINEQIYFNTNNIEEVKRRL